MENCPVMLLAECCGRRDQWIVKYKCDMWFARVNVEKLVVEEVSLFRDDAIRMAANKLLMKLKGEYSTPEFERGHGFYMDVDNPRTIDCNCGAHDQRKNPITSRLLKPKSSFLCCFK